MRAIELFASSVKYRYKTTICSPSTFLVLVVFLIIVFAPVYFIYHAGGIYKFNLFSNKYYYSFHSFTIVILFYLYFNLFISFFKFH